MIIGTVPYMNCLPLTKHLKRNLVKLPPAQLAEAVLSGEVDLALLPTFSILKHDLLMHPDAGIIGCDGAVKSVGFFVRPYISDLSEIESIYLDQESQSSVFLAKVLLKKYYDVSLYDLEFFHHDNRDMADAQILIGDKALFHNNKRSFFLDLGQLWKDFTNTGIMFACWASKKAIPAEVIAELVEAKQLGLMNKESCIADVAPDNQELVLDYLENNIIYEPNDAIKAGLKLFKEHLREYQYIEHGAKAA
jgi:chorismate dehydratase